MKHIALTAAFLALAVSSSVIAQDRLKSQDNTQLQAQSRDQIYGSQLMTQQERNEYIERMRSAKTEQERERIRQEHHARMQDRAKERGVSLPASPPAKRAASGAGQGPGVGAGPGGSGGAGGGRGGR